MIQPLTLADAASAAHIHAQCFGAGWPVDIITPHIETDICLGVFTPNLSGFMILKRAQDQAEIITIAIGPDYQRQGLARRLLTRGYEALRARGVSVLFLEVAEDNHAAIALYKASGFHQIGKRPAYYRRATGRMAALTYRKNLSA